MKSSALILLGLLFSVICRAEAPKTKDDLLAAVRSAFAAKDIQRIHALTWEKGMSDFDKVQEDKMLPMVLDQSAGVDSVSFQPLPPDFMDIPVAFGRRIDVTHPADGIIRIFQTPKNKNFSSSNMDIPYALIDGAYYLVTVKTTDVGWKGPQDKALIVNVTGKGQDKVKIHIKYNASGVDVERDQFSASEGVAGQYIREVTVKSDSDDVNVTLTLWEDGKNYYKSEALTGRGQIHYARPEPSPATPEK